ESGPEEKQKITADRDFDRFGNVQTLFDAADDSTADDDTFTVISYRNDTSRWILGRAATIAVHGGTATGPVLRSRGGTYSDLGDLIARDIATGNGIATSSLEYDAFGNLARLVSPPNEAGEQQSHSYTFDAVTHHYVATVTDGFGLTSSTDYDLRFCEA